MLKSLLILPENYDFSINKCGEIFYKNRESFYINCNYCSIKLFSFNEFLNHIEIHVTNIKKEDCTSDQEQIDSETIFEDKPCYAEDDYRDDDDFDVNSNRDSEEEEEEGQQNMSILRKYKSRRPKEFCCEKCSKKFVDLRALNSHIRMIHERDKTFKCLQCDHAFHEERSLKKHETEHHQVHTCPVCSREFSCRRYLSCHLKRVHSETKEHKCPEKNCFKAYATKKQLSEHIRLHNRENYICEECGYKCRAKESLVVHKRRHTGENPFSCNVPGCDRNFGSKALLKEHQDSHVLEKKHICDICGKGFNRPKTLYHHKHLHLGIKKFICKMCGQKFAQAAGLSAHLRKHREGEGSSKLAESDTSSYLNMFQSNATS